MRARVPASVTDNSYSVFPEGTYEGILGTAELRDPKNDGSWVLLQVKVEGVSPKEGTADPGRDRFQSDITIKTDGVDLFEIADFSNGELPFGIRRASGLLCGLAEGLGIASRENGATDVDLKEVAGALIDGQFAGEKVSFEVSHYTPAGGKARDQYNRFGSA